MKGHERNERQSVNTISLFVTFICLFMAVQFSSGGVDYIPMGEVLHYSGGLVWSPESAARGQQYARHCNEALPRDLFATKINKITENLDNAVLELDNNVSYTDYVDKSKYFSNTEFNAAAMAGLYNLTNLFIDFIAPEDILREDVVNVIRHGDTETFQVSDVMKYYALLVAIVLFLVLCVLLFPLCGLCFCCCRCCGNCGAKPQPSDKKRDTCRKVVQASLLIMCGTGLLFCVVCAFGSNQQLQDGIESFPTNLQVGVNDSKTFMVSAVDHLHVLLIQNYEEFNHTFFGVMENASEIALNQLMVFANATSVSRLYVFADSLPHIRDTLTSLKRDTNKLRVYASQLNDAIRKVKRDLTITLNNCSDRPSCKEMKYEVDQLQTKIDFNKLPDVSGTIADFSKLDIDGIQKAANRSRKSLEDIRNGIESSLNSALTEAESQIKRTDRKIKENFKSINDTVDQMTDQIDESVHRAIKTIQQYIDQYGKHRYYVGLTISCILLFVTLCIVLGLICGICGKRPDGYSDNCCNKGTGSQFLICAVAVMFLFGFIISNLTLISLIVGVISEKAICDPLRNPDPQKFYVIKLLDDVNLGFDVKVTPSTLLKNCYQNKSIYTTFNLQKQFDIDETRKQFDIRAQLDKLNISYEIPDDFLLMDNDTFNELLKFNPEINAEKFADELHKNFTNYSMDELIEGLKKVISDLNKPGDEEVRSQVGLSLLHLTTYDEKLVIPMKEVCQNLTDAAATLEEQLKMNSTDFTTAINELQNEIVTAEVTLKTNGKTKLDQTAVYFKNITLNLVDGYTNRVFDQVQNEVGQCGPLSTVINATLTATCERVLLPWNGFWLSLFWTIILYVITIIISVKLANLYQKHKPYDQYIETEYLYDAYADRGDSIPLNSRGGKRGKKKGKKTRRYEERPNVGRDAARDYPVGSHPPDGRYADMAPKHWEEFPNGGPPHYQRAPTEYERPPPYYYPGSGGEH